MLILLHTGAGSYTSKKTSPGTGGLRAAASAPGLAQSGSGTEQRCEREAAGCTPGSGTAAGSRTSFLAVVKGRLAPLCSKISHPQPSGAVHPVTAALRYQREKWWIGICSTNAISFLIQEQSGYYFYHMYFIFLTPFFFPVSHGLSITH